MCSGTHCPMFLSPIFPIWKMGIQCLALWLENTANPWGGGASEPCFLTLAPHCHYLGSLTSLMPRLAPHPNESRISGVGPGSNIL